MTKKLWIAKEQREFRIELLSKRRNKNSDTKIMLRIITLLILICAFSYASADLLYCPHCMEKIEFKGVWGQTWICPKPSCGYENYEAVQYCGICGTSRYAKECKND